MAQWVNNPVLPQLWLRFDPWPGNFQGQHVWLNKKKKIKKKKKKMYQIFKFVKLQKISIINADHVFENHIGRM